MGLPYKQTCWHSCEQVKYSAGAHLIMQANKTLEIHTQVFERSTAKIKLPLASKIDKHAS